MIMLLVAVMGLLIIVGCGYWVMSGAAQEWGFRVQAPNLKTCPQCGASLNPNLDHCEKCSLRTSV